MSQTAVIQLVKSSTRSSITLEQLEEDLLEYKEALARTGTQLNWSYDQAAFPYTLEKKADNWFYLKGMHDQYAAVVFRIVAPEDRAQSADRVQVILPDYATHGDKAKGNEFCKYLAKLWNAKLQLFNGRTLHYNHYR